MQRLSTIPQINHRILSVILDENSCAEDLARELSRDQASTAHVLRLVNSAYYGFCRRIDSVKEATAILGFDMVRRIVLTASEFDSTRNLGGRVIERRVYWEHALACAAAAEILSREEGINASSAYFAGLLHDLGKLVLDEYFSELFERALVRSLESGSPLYAAEREILGTDHAEAGYWLAERWNLPPLLVHAIRFHHSPEDCTDLRSMPLVQLVYAANRVSKALQEPEGGAAGDPQAAAEPPHIEAARRELLNKKPLIANLCYTVLP